MTERPAWLDVDSIVPPDLQARMKAMTERVEPILGELERLAYETRLLLREYGSATNAADVHQDDMLDLLHKVTPSDALWGVWLNIRDLFDQIESLDPDWPERLTDAPPVTP